ncbi:MAG: DoxX family protein [Halieaceae bacterium]|jgi:uncharacterized membrane protein YphA (DoxX/SURF4 family)|nr:DoxX family protein [Halieaceae bacterium]
MASIVQSFGRFQESVWTRIGILDGLPSLALRLYLFFPFWVAGTQKLRAMENTVDWFANSDWGLGLPFPALLAHLAAYTETVGAVLLLLGLATRWAAIPLIITMLVAIFVVHWPQGWAAVADSSAPEVAQRLGEARELLREHGNYDWLTEKGGFVILNNGIEFAVTYLVMLLALLFSGGGRFVSADYYLGRLLYR